jgi:hypothetical protein
MQLKYGKNESQRWVVESHKMSKWGVEKNETLQKQHDGRNYYIPFISIFEWSQCSQRNKLADLIKKQEMTICCL